jgi:hypothetical protein
VNKELEMTRVLFLVNALLTLPFGLVALFAPAAIFAGFGLTLDPGGALVARGYAATCLGYGVVFLLLRKTTEPAVTRALLAAAVIFNLVETVIQGTAAQAGTAQPVIWVTVGAHALTASLCAVALVQTRR